MSFFGFDTTLPRDRGHTTNAPGFAAPSDAFAGLSGKNANDDDDAIDFEETYDGLADQLDETDDAFNDDTFGGGPATQQSIGKDFDFSGQTAKVAETLQEEQMLFQARQPPRKASPVQQPAKPARTGYEKYKEPEHIPKLQADASIWGTGIWGKSAAQSQAQPQYSRQESPAPAAASKKMMSLEEVEASMRAQRKQPPPQPQPAFPQHQPAPETQMHAMPSIPQMAPQFPAQGPQAGFPPPGFGGPPHIMQRPQQHPMQPPPSGPRQPTQAELSGHGVQPPHMHQQPQILQRPRQPPTEPVAHRQTVPQPQISRPPSQPRHILQNPNRLSGHGQPIAQPQYPHAPGVQANHNRGPSFQGHVVTHPEQLLNLTDEERAAFLLEDAKRAKRNHKIHLLSKDNGLMTPQDKNFITRIQLQQLVTSTGGADEQGPDAALAEDFYYQVYTQIRGAPRQNPQQPANQFAQTYLFQTGGRYGAGRRHHRGADNHIQRMEQQVQRAVEAAKAKPKNKQLVIEGSLGKISFSNAKTPKPLLNIKRTESGDVRPASAGRRPSKAPGIAATDRKTTLRDIEKIYSTLMQLEDHERRIPPPLNENSDPMMIQQHMEWQQKLHGLNAKLWDELKVMEPIIPNTPHPFIAILSHPKGKKALPRIFRHIDEKQRITIVTIIVVQLDSLDVVAAGVPGPDELTLPPTVRAEIELFMHTVMNVLHMTINEQPLAVMHGLLDLALSKTHIPLVVRTRVGLSLLTMFVSRAELLRQSTPDLPAQEWESWQQLYNRLFDAVEPYLPHLFPGSVNDVEDVYVWQFLAAMGVEASPDQQQRLVIGVKDRVMETVAVAKALPADMASARLGHVNLFMRAIGLDVELLG